MLRELPEGWEWKKIKDICQIFNGRAFKPTDWSDEGLPIVRIQNLNDNSAGFNYCNFPVDERHIINDGQLLFSWSGTPGTSFGAFIWNRGKAVLNQHIFRIELDEEKLDKKYLMAALNSRIQDFIQRAHGTSGLEHITKGIFENTLLPIPPLLIQRQIVAVLEQAEAVKRDRQEADALTGALLQSVFFEMFGDPVRNEKGWDLSKIEEICDEITVGIVVRPASYYVENGVPTFRSLNIRPDELNLENFVYISSSDNDTVLAKSKIRTGDVLVVRTGYPGTACVVPPEFDGANCIDLIILRPKKQLVDCNYLSRFLNSDYGKAQALAGNTGLAQQHLNIGAIRQVKIPLPPLALQQQFARVVERVERIREQQVASGKEIEGLCEGLMAKAFAGELVG